MTFVNREKIGIAAHPKAAHLDFPRAETLRIAFQKCVEEYYLNREIADLEVRGMVVTGQPRVGKFRDMKELIRYLNPCETLMPDGRQAKIVSGLLSGCVTFKGLGIKP